MNSTKFILCAFAVAIGGSSLLLSSPEQDTDRYVTQAEDIVWEDRAGGVKAAVLYGDPTTPGPFVLRLRYPAGYEKGPHYHPADAFVTVLSGKYFRGYGAVEDRSNAYALERGTFSVNPEGVSHFEWTTEPAELEIHATGPWGTTFVDTNAHPIPER